MIKDLLRELSAILPDKVFLKLRFRQLVHHPLNLENPRTFNEKLQWLKMYDRREEYQKMVDKSTAKDYFSSKMGSNEFLIPTYGVWDSFDDIDFDSLPDRFVLKTTHDSGGVVVCPDKSKLDIKAARKKLAPRLKRNYYWHAREWPYKHLKPHIIAEELVGNGVDPLIDYKLMCFNGKFKCTVVCSERFSKDGIKATFYDPDWNILPFKVNHPITTVDIPKPQQFDKMVETAEKMAEGFPFLRVDFYEVGGKIYFGELTFFTESGFEPILPFEWDERLGDWIELPKEKRRLK